MKPSQLQLESRRHPQSRARACAGRAPFWSLLAVCCWKQAASVSEDSRVAPLPVALRVDFSFHGSDWTQGSCASRATQSPVNLNVWGRPATDFFQYYYGRKDSAPWELTVANDGRTISADVATAGLGGLSFSDRLGGAPWYPLERIDVHASSEHTLNGEHAPLEIQLVHRAPTGSTAGHELVTLSVLVDCDSPPQPPPQPQPLVSSADLQALQIHSRTRRFSSRVNLSHASGAASINRGRTSQVPVGYFAPSASDPGFNPALQAFVALDPPVVQDSVTLTIGGDPNASSLHLSDLLSGGTYFMYRGSETLPPCEERVVWLVRREKVRASNAQVMALFSRLYSTTNGAGNYRTIMPMNQRGTLILSAEPLPLESTSTAAPTVENYNQSFELASDALATAKELSVESKELASKVQATLDARAAKRAKDAQDAATSAANMRAAVKQEISTAITEQVIPAAQDLTRVYFKKGFLHAGT